ncbi:MAG: Nif3-like dinuclear metal center hexameric protein [Thermoleophilia bacterium]
MSPVRLADLVGWFDETLAAQSFRDYGPNGLQVVGADQVSRVCTAVSVSLEVIERAAADNAQVLLVHHGLFWDGADARIGPLERRRLEALFAADLSLVAYHLPLDAHATLGNNARLADLLGLTQRVPFGEHQGVAIGWSGALPAATTATELAATLGGLIGSTPLVLPGGDHPVRTVGIVSGGAARDIRQAAAAGLDAFITGEPSEDAAYLAAELGVHFIAAGHNATETVGVQALAEAAAAQFDLSTSFLAVDNPV